MYQSMKEALRARMGRGVRELIMSKGDDEPREVLGLAPDSKEDISEPGPDNRAEIAEELMMAADEDGNPEFEGNDESMLSLARDLKEGSKDNMGMSKKPKTIAEAAMMAKAMKK